MNEEDLEQFNERAAIMEYDGGLSRSEAEAMARLEVLSKPQLSRQQMNAMRIKKASD